MNIFSRFWQFCNTPHCMCGEDVTKRPICFKFEERSEGGVCLCHHLPACHLINQFAQESSHHAPQKAD